MNRQLLEQLLGCAPPPGSYCWVVVRDLGDWLDHDETLVGTAGPSTATAEQIESARAGGRRFRLVDGDGIEYCEGRIWLADPDKTGSELDFRPLWDWGEPALGCVDIRYLSEDRWVAL